MKSLNIHIAVVEDDLQERKIICECLAYLEKTGGLSFQISEFDNGESFLQWYSPEYDLILMDIMMPGLNGMETARQLREKDAQVALIFVCSAWMVYGCGFQTGF